MHVKPYVREVSSLVLWLLMFLVVCAGMVAPSRGKTQQSKHVPESMVRERISILIRDTMSQGAHVVNGVKIWMRPQPSNEALDEVHGYGDTAVPVLTDYLKSEDVREREVAMRFLGQLGGSQIVEPLRMVLLNDASAGIRELALRWLTSAPWDLASPIIERAAESDVDPKVREAAKSILVKHDRK